MSERKRGFSTTAVHAGKVRDKTAGAVVTPIYQTSTFEFEDTEAIERQASGARETYLYTRHEAPNQRVIEEKMAALEGGEKSIVFSAGMAAISTLTITLVSGKDEIVAFQDLYGRTYHLFAQLLPRFGVKVHLIETGDYGAFERAISERTKLLYFETPTNPLIKIVDLRRMAELGRKYRVLTAVDGTFASPYNQRPIDYEIDLVVHSCTKYLGGHSDLLAGVVTGPTALVDEMRETLKTLGGVLDPHAAFLLERGMKTLSARMRVHNENGMQVATFLEEHPSVNKVYYPGLPSHPDHELAVRQMREFGGMVCFEVQGGRAGAARMLNNVKIGRLAASLGGVETLLSMPLATSHRAMPAEQRHRAGITDGMVRLSLGIEDGEDIIADLKRVLDEMV